MKVVAVVALVYFVAIPLAPKLAAGMVQALTAGLTSPSETGPTDPAALSSCSQLRQHYPHGVGRPGAHDHKPTGHAKVTDYTRDADAYRTVVHAHPTWDRDHDGIACEQ